MTDVVCTPPKKVLAFDGLMLCIWTNRKLGSLTWTASVYYLWWQTQNRLRKLQFYQQEIKRDNSTVWLTKKMISERFNGFFRCWLLRVIMWPGRKIKRVLITCWRPTYPEVLPGPDRSVLLYADSTSKDERSDDSESCLHLSLKCFLYPRFIFTFTVCVHLCLWLLHPAFSASSSRSSSLQFSFIVWVQN